MMRERPATGRSGGCAHKEAMKMENLVIIGGGIAGLTAAVYAGRADLSPLVIEGAAPGGQLALTTEVENFPGFPEGIQGPELVARVRKQAEKFGARFMSGNATSFEANKDGTFTIGLGEEKIVAKAAVIATGADARTLGLESEKKYFGKGVSTCATCDAFFFKGKKVTVIGGGDSACEEALTLSKFADKVTIIHRRDSFRASKIMQERVFKNPKIDVVWDSAVVEVLGDGTKVTGVKVKNLKTGEEKAIECDGMFLAIGHIPNTKIFEGVLELDEKGYLKADERMRTNVPGAFAAGDVFDYYFQQAVTAAASGCKAAMEAEKYLAEKE